MKVLTAIVRELAGLFADDGMFAMALLGVIAVSAMVVHFVHDGTGGIVLVVGVLFALFANVMA